MRDEIGAPGAAFIAFTDLARAAADDEDQEPEALTGAAAAMRNDFG